MSSWWCGAGGATAAAQRRRSSGCSGSCVKRGGAAAATALLAPGRAVGRLSLRNKWVKLLHHLDPAVSPPAWGFQCLYSGCYLHSWSLCGANPKVKCLLSTAAVGNERWWIAGLFQAAVPTVQLASCHEGGWPDNLRWGLRGETEGGGTSQGAGLPLGFSQLSIAASSRVADGAPREPGEPSQGSQGHSQESGSPAAAHPRIIWLLSLQVPPVESSFPLPDGKTDKAEHVLVTLSAGVDGRLSAAVSGGLLIVLAVDALLEPNWREDHHVFDNIYVGSKMEPLKIPTNELSFKCAAAATTFQQSRHGHNTLHAFPWEAMCVSVFWQWRFQI